jgi:hypothetical protein
MKRKKYPKFLLSTFEKGDEKCPMVNTVRIKITK